MQDQQLTLINSTYAPQQAREVLCSLLNDKIKFLNHQILSTFERFGSDTSHLERRLEEIKAERDQLTRQLKALDNEEYLLEIDCRINIKVTTPEMA
ncbi:hypothetical protein [Lewinella sp. LCG006]|uniref:hypothetical protein n=1 Tax=Lewinella sp. LCG006 TaxID=3231911 RepID=UPI00345F669F